MGDHDNKITMAAIRAQGHARLLKNPLDLERLQVARQQLRREKLMTIQEAAAASGLSIDTIRFYEKAGMLPPVPRDARGWRSFPPGLVDWLKNLARLRATGMPMAEMQRFARLVHAPESPEVTAERLAILHGHGKRLDRRLAEIEAAQSYLTYKIAVYAGKDRP
jgi:MerR family transcriptional regulator, aldehyde-responsive regulator